MKHEHKPELLVNGSHGVYLPQSFIEATKGVEGWNYKVTDDTVNIVETEGPDHMDYWECWSMIMDNSVFTHEDGTEYYLQTDCGGCNLWAVPEGMDIDEYDGGEA